MILDSKKEDREEPVENGIIGDYEEQEEPRELTDRERRLIIEQSLKEIGYEMDPELVDIVNKEGDFEEWVDPYSNYLCRISRMLQFQTWNGYVRIPHTHPCFAQDYDDVDVNVHGGLSYGHYQFPNHGHDYSEETDKNYYWFGFDTAHAWDRQPRIIIHFPSPWGKNDVYRDKDYIIKEVTSLAKQLKDMEGC
jgi:hypothetical protein